MRILQVVCALAVVAAWPLAGAAEAAQQSGAKVVESRRALGLWLYGTDGNEQYEVRRTEASERATGEWSARSSAALRDREGRLVALGGAYQASDLGTHSVTLSLDGRAKTSGRHALQLASVQHEHCVRLRIERPMRFDLRAQVAVLGSASMARLHLWRVGGPTRFDLLAVGSEEAARSLSGWLRPGDWWLEASLELNAFGSLATHEGVRGNTECELHLSSELERQARATLGHTVARPESAGRVRARETASLRLVSCT